MMVSLFSAVWLMETSTRVTMVVTGVPIPSRLISITLLPKEATTQSPFGMVTVTLVVGVKVAVTLGVLVFVSVLVGVQVLVGVPVLVRVKVLVEVFVKVGVQVAMGHPQGVLVIVGVLVGGTKTV